MKKTVALILALMMLLLSGCNSDLESRIGGLEEQVALLQTRVESLEEENALLRAQMNTPAGELAAPEAEYEPAAELILYDWSIVEDLLALDGAFARAMYLGEGTGVASCSLILLKNGEGLEASSLTLLPGEAVDSYELELGPLAYHLPELAEGDILELMLEVLLSDGRVLTAWGGSWDYLDGKLVMIAG